MSPEIGIYLPDADDLKPRANLPGFTREQPYHLVWSARSLRCDDAADD
jgi:hypothetical protein